MSPIFNSLGSNYTKDFVNRSNYFLLRPHLWHRHADSSELTKNLNDEFLGKSSLNYKGRGSLTDILIAFGIGPEDEVLTQAFTCWALESAIRESGAKPVFTDIAANSLNLSLETLHKAFANTKKAKAVILQHTLGYPVDPKPIADWCREHNLVLIEDLAHGYGATDSEGKSLGTYADAVLLSFGRDKIVDAITGGADIIKHYHLANIDKMAGLRQIIPDEWLKFPATSVIIKDLIYPQLTSTIRATYSIGLGKFFHLLFTKLGLLASPLQAPSPRAALPLSFSQIAYQALKATPANIEHRCQISKFYHQHLKNPSVLITDTSINYATCLRYPLIVSNRKELLAKLKQHQIYLSDIWYKRPVDTGRLHHISHYQEGSCPHAEALSEQIINLPTHINIDIEKAKKIVEIINNS
jgi:dTDP-4-amino-4,6-dideoxygalactose transaminase